MQVTLGTGTRKRRHRLPGGPTNESVEERDEVLVERSRRGDRDAFRQLVVRYRQGLFSLASRMLGRREEAEDIVQESFLRAFRSIPEFRGESRFSTWVYRICRNLCRNELEWRGRWRTGDTVPEELPSSSAGSLERLVTDERRRLVEWGLSRLSVEFREVLTLRHHREMSYEEMAEVLDLAVGTVRSRLHRGRDRLREILRPHWRETP